MSKILITTTDMADKIFPLDEKKNIDEVVIFNKEKDAIPVNIVKEMFVARQNEIIIQFLQYGNKDELMFRLGSMISKEHIYLVSDGIFVLPDWLTMEYNITVDGEKTKAPKGKKQTTRTSKTPKRTPEVEEMVDMLKSLEKDDSAAFQPVLPKLEEPTAEEVKQFTVSETPKKSRKSSKKEEVKDEVKQESAFDDVTDDIEEKDKTLNHVLTEKEILELTTGFKHTEDVIKEFLKRSGVRASDTHTSMTDEQLGDIILTMLEADADKTRIKNELTEFFENDADAKTIFQWINPQITKLHQLAIS